MWSDLLLVYLPTPVVSPDMDTALQSLKGTLVIQIAVSLCCSELGGLEMPCLPAARSCKRLT